MKVKTRKVSSLEEILERVSDVLFPGGKCDVTVFSRDTDGDTALHKVAIWGDRNAVDVLIDAGAEVDTSGDMGNTPLHYAVTYNHVSVAETLLENGANPNRVNEFGRSPRQTALKSENKLMISLFRAPMPNKSRQA